MKRNREEIIDLQSIKRQKILSLYERLNEKKLTKRFLENNDLNVNEVNREGDPLIIGVIKTIDIVREERDEYIFKALQKNGQDLQKYNIRMKELWDIVSAIVDHPKYEPQYLIKREYYIPHFLVYRAIHFFKQALERKRKVLLLDNKKLMQLLLNLFHKDQEIENNILDKILSHPKCPINAYNKEGETALHVIAGRFRYRDIAQNTIMECCVLHPQDLVLDVAALLFKYSRYVNYREEQNGQSALHYACKYNDPWMLLLLLKFTEDSTINDKFGRIPSYYSKLLRTYVFKEDNLKSIYYNLRYKGKRSQSITTAILNIVQSMQEEFHIALKNYFF